MGRADHLGTVACEARHRLQPRIVLAPCDPADWQNSQSAWLVLLRSVGFSRGEGLQVEEVGVSGILSRNFGRVAGDGFEFERSTWQGGGIWLRLALGVHAHGDEQGLQGVEARPGDLRLDGSLFEFGDDVPDGADDGGHHEGKMRDGAGF